MICTLATMGATAVGAGASAVGLLRHQAGSLRRAFDEDENRPHSTFAEAIAAPRHRDDDDSAALAIIGDSWLCGVDVDAEQAPPTLIGRGLWAGPRSEEHTSELQSRGHLVCRLLLEKK